ncbi:MAG: ATP-binding cassette domain-containing protein [Ilumatobacteraceae bacterium]|nr:ATP-binding cassette domain-containing protein [Ilumatobacter sp.]MCB9382828.1 ATP-binding cassette domain-containing protein [Acidimicrobiaceae bacterium]
MSTDALLQLDDVGFSYSRHRTVLQDVTASFAAGSVTAISGPSGCGKSTLLNILGLLLRVESGTVKLAGRDVGGASDAERAAWRARHVGFVFQDALLDPAMTVAENLLEGLPLQRSRRSAAATMRDLLEQFGIGDLAHRPASRLSGGQGQRVALVRALLKDPTMVLADEPTGNLDDVTAEVVLSALLDFGRRPGRAAVVVTHDRRIVARADQSIELPVSRR